MLNHYMTVYDCKQGSEQYPKVFSLVICCNAMDFDIYVTDLNVDVRDSSIYVRDFDVHVTDFSNYAKDLMSVSWNLITMDFHC